MNDRPALRTAKKTTRADAALRQLSAPVRKQLSRAGMVSALSELLWAAQVACVAFAIDALVRETGTPNPIVAAGLFLAIALVRAVLDRAATAMAQKAASKLVADTRTRLIGASARLDARARTPAPAVLASLVAEKVAVLAPWAARYEPAMWRVRIVPLILIAMVAYFSWAAALVLIVTGPLIPVFMALVGIAAKESSERQMAEVGTLNTLLVDRISALTDLRLLGAEERAVRSLSDASDNLRERTMKVLAIAFLSSTVLELFAAIGVAMLAIYTGFSLLGEINFGTWDGPLTPAGAIFILMIAPEYFQPLRDMAAAWHDRASAQAVAEEIIATEADIARSGEILGNGDAATALPPAPLRWNGLHVRPGPDAPVLNLPDGCVSPGQAIGIKGHSGVGKTTLLSTLAGLIRPESGHVHWGETLLDADSADRIRAGIGWLPQTPRFINAPLSQALTFGRQGDLAAALTAAQANDIIATLPGGLDARLGDLGGGVSGGEARRLLIARAFHTGATLVLADEPTADLDPETAQAVLAGLMALRARGVALVVASHDARVLDAMDDVITLHPTEAA